MIAVIFLIVVVGIFGTFAVSLVSTESLISVSEMQSTRAFYVADGGLEWALYKYQSGTACTALSGGSGTIGLDGVGSAASGAVNGTTLSWLHLIGSQSDRLLVVGVEIEDGSSSDAVVSSVTYNGVNLTRAATAIAGTSFFQNVELWYLLEAGLPPAGNYTVTVTTTGITDNRNGGSISLYSVNQAAPEATNTQTSNSGQSTFNTTITTLTGGAWIVGAIGSGNNSTSFTTNQAGQTEQYDTGSSGGSSTGAGSTKEVTTAGLTTMGWNVAGANRLAHVVAAFAPAETSVSQNQCLIISTGTVPIGIGSDSATRVVEETYSQSQGIIDWREVYAP